MKKLNYTMKAEIHITTYQYLLKINQQKLV